MKLLTMALVIGSSLFSAALPAGARTPGGVCRQACRPSLDERCGGLTGGEKRRCRRPVIRACKATTPAIGCPTTADLTSELGDQRLAVSDASVASVTLCASGSFDLTGTPAGDPNSPVQAIPHAAGSWTVEIVDHAPAIVFQVNGDGSVDPLPIGHDATGALVVNGRPAETFSAAVACNPSDQPSPDDQIAAQVTAIARALADKAIVIDAPDGNTDQREELQLCSSGRVVQTFITSGTPPSIQTFRGTWTIGSSGTLQLDLGTGQAVFGVEVQDDGQIVVDEAPVTQRDARAECADLDLSDRFTSALNGKAFFFVQQATVVPVRTTLGLCDSGRYQEETTSTQVGDWRVRVVGGVATLALQSDNPQILQQRFELAFDASGNVTVQGGGAIDDQAIVDAACQS